MIDRTFLHCRGVGPKTDHRLKSQGFLTWQDCLEQQSDLPFEGPRKKRFLETIRMSLTALKQEDLEFLTHQLPPCEHWRILATYFPEATFFDIETTGLSSYDCIVTVITAYFRDELYTFIYDENLDDFLHLVNESKLLVAFNGNSFDVPFLENAFNLPDIGCPYIDLRWICYHQGYRGGLKTIEKQLDLKRPLDVRNIDGYEAVRLFNRWQTGDETAGKKLVRYCESDVLATYLTAGRLLQESGLNLSLPDPDAFFTRTGKKWLTNRQETPQVPT